MASWSGLYHQQGDATGYALQQNASPTLRRIARDLKRRSSVRLGEVIDTVTTSASINGAAARTRRQVQGTVDPGNASVHGGSVTVETVTEIAASSTTTAADVTLTTDLANYSSVPASYPVDAGGNGGGGKNNTTSRPSLG